uniref:Protein kinase domain-containing protein n=1 Tax=Syphacia muris TaxID=451379 RepID=A0A0N5AIN5_9BILA
MRLLAVINVLLLFILNFDSVNSDYEFEQPFIGYLITRNYECDGDPNGIAVLDYASKQAWCYSLKSLKQTETYKKGHVKRILMQSCGRGVPAQIYTDQENDFFNRFLIPTKVQQKVPKQLVILRSPKVRNVWKLPNDEDEFCVYSGFSYRLSSSCTNFAFNKTLFCKQLLSFIKLSKQLGAPAKAPDLFEDLHYAKDNAEDKEYDQRKSTFKRYILVPKICSQLEAKLRSAKCHQKKIEIHMCSFSCVDNYRHSDGDNIRNCGYGILVQQSTNASGDSVRATRKIYYDVENENAAVFDDFNKQAWCYYAKNASGIVGHQALNSHCSVGNLPTVSVKLDILTLSKVLKTLKIKKIPLTIRLLYPMKYSFRSYHTKTLNPVETLIEPILDKCLEEEINGKINVVRCQQMEYTSVLCKETRSYLLPSERLTITDFCDRHENTTEVNEILNFSMPISTTQQMPYKKSCIIRNFTQTKFHFFIRVDPECLVVQQRLMAASYLFAMTCLAIGYVIIRCFMVSTILTSDSVTETVSHEENQELRNIVSTVGKLPTNPNESSFVKYDEID